jgi:two-component system response regulator VanR
MAPQILVVDDEARYLHLVKVNLEAAGYEVKCASNGEEALEMMSNHSPDLVILDIMMPRLVCARCCAAHKPPMAPHKTGISRMAT